MFGYATAVPADPTFTEFALSTPFSFPSGITAGADGNLWFTEAFGNRIGRITPAGEITEFPVPTPMSTPEWITAGPDGNLWFAEFRTNKIGRITPGGEITEFAVPTPGSGPLGITAGPDGNVWFTEAFGNQMGRIAPVGDIMEFAVPTLMSTPAGITAGPDGNLWFTEFNVSQIGRGLRRRGRQRVGAEDSGSGRITRFVFASEIEAEQKNGGTTLKPGEQRVPGAPKNVWTALKPPFEVMK